MSTYRKPPFWATTLTIAGVGVLCALGTWQMHRLEWKENLITRIHAYDKSEVRTLSVQELTPENEFLKGRLKGRFEFEKEIVLKPRTHDGKPGIHVITPFVLDSGNTILVNRGWVPLDQDWSKQAKSEIEVILRAPKDPNIFVPENVPSTDQWYSLDVEAISEAKDLSDPLSVVGYQLDTDTAGEHIYPDPAALTIRLNNNHLQYAIFWYTMALIMIAVFVLRFIKPTEKTV